MMDKQMATSSAMGLTTGAEYRQDERETVLVFFQRACSQG